MQQSVIRRFDFAVLLWMARENSVKRIKMLDVAAAAGVSAMTVSRALKKDGRIADETRKHILSVIEQLGYVPDQIAASFSSQKSRFIAALVPSLNNPHFAETVRALSETLEDEGMQILLGQTNYQPAREERLVQELLSRRPEAIVMTADAHTPRTLMSIKRAGVPVVEIWDTPSNALQHQIGFSNFDAARAMVRYLVSCGYQRITYVGEIGDEGMRGARRRDGFIAGIAEAGLGEPRIHLHAALPLTMSEGPAVYAAIQSRWPDSDAIMCVSDPCAFGVMMAAVSSGRSIPQDIGIAGFGNFEIGRCSVPTLTTVGVDAYQLGLKAAHLVRDKKRLNGSEAQHISLPFEVFARGSTIVQSRNEMQVAGHTTA